ncbi:glycosyl hydrolase 115 family protein [Chitinophagaceae bacterium LB-8]|uniref:Glycosyl hydrolase 115 family protein n=1 Tax=Paraflavisolibacter caeni TaxID=2982496 RepID=A0A9X3BGB4_9BACT|nr:glycosyl hydrolase 115 family protein [Paraflavisolibacter caeni]MCU7550644.1 glycosyl hydrolase 115 family protein [Paraflavisolibacter caeni]
MYRYTLLKPGIAILFICSLFTLGVHAQQVKENKISILQNKQSGSFPLVTGGNASSIYFDATDAPVVRIAAKALKEDIKLVTGITAALDSSNALQPYSVIIGTIGNSKLIDQLISTKKLKAAQIKGSWERFAISVIDQPFGKVKQALIVAGSDPRGTAFGVFELSKMMGVSPFYWWADITPVPQKELFITKGTILSAPPSVKYRGIFLNDEDWGLQPWAAKTFEPETGDIGPKTYARIFELLLRLKANLIWPAMHPSTKAFYHYAGNPKVAADYGIIVGSSHAEPMLRNNVGEWNEKTMGHFNYITNKERVYSYWEDRVKQSKGNDAIYTMGMRGVHDSHMEGVKDEKEAVPLLERIIADQRGLLSQYMAKDVTSIPQAFTAYKEVLDIYDNGLKLPEDITLVWPDDNYGYIQRLNNEKEQARAGGSGVYYHASYWGRPHDYLWLSSMHPSLMREEMMKAYETGANRLWVLNVGDIKPLEYNIEQFLDMAYDATPFRDSRYVRVHMNQWISNIFGKEQAQRIGRILWDYYHLAFERRPEFMGWSQTEPTTKTSLTEYNHFYYGDEAQRRIDQYEALEKEVKALRAKVDAKRADAFYELVYYPVVGASWMNKKFLYRDKAAFYAKQNRWSALDYAALSKAAYDSIVTETEYYNTKLANGKWKYMMSFKPRDLPVYQTPVFPEMAISGGEGWSIAPEGYVRKDSSLLKEAATITLPTFDDIYKQKYFIDIFLNDKKQVAWASTVSHPWIKLSQSSGVLSPETGKTQMRLWVEVDWNKASKEEQLSGSIVFRGVDKERIVEVQGRKLSKPELSHYKGFIENNGYVSINATNFTRQTAKGSMHWKVIDDLGYTGKTLQVLPFKTKEVSLYTDAESIKKNSAYVEYDFYTFTVAAPEVNVFTLPTHPLNNKFSMRYAVSVDNGPVKVVDFRTFGRSEEWKQNVLSNRAGRKIQLPFLDKGNHTLRIYCVDPGVTLDEIRIDLGGLKKAYSTLPETKSENASKTAFKKASL